jgi:hypothetical protein
LERRRVDKQVKRNGQSVAIGEKKKGHCTPQDHAESGVRGSAASGMTARRLTQCGHVMERSDEGLHPTDARRIELRQGRKTLPGFERMSSVEVDAEETKEDFVQS